MYKKQILLPAIFFLSFLQLTHVPNAHAMLAATFKANTARAFVLRRPTSFLMTRNRVQAPPKRLYSNNMFKEAVETLNAFAQSDRETIRNFLSSQSLVNSISVLEKNTKSYEDEINRLKSMQEDFTLIKVRDSLDCSSNANTSNQQQESTADGFNQENLDVGCKSFCERYAYLKDAVNKFLTHINAFMKTPTSQNALETFENLKHEAQTINDKLIFINQIFLESKDRRDYLYLQRQSDSASRSFFSEELQKLTEETKRISNKCNEKISILKFVLDNSQNLIDANDVHSIKGIIQTLGPHQGKLKELEEGNRNNELKAKGLEKWLASCESYVKELEEYVEKNSSSNLHADSYKCIDVKIDSALKSIAEVEKEIENLKSFPPTAAGIIEMLLSKHSREKSLFQNMAEMKELQQYFHNSNLTEIIEKNIEIIKKESRNISNKNKENIDWSKKLEEKFEDLKKIILEVKAFIKNKENLIKKLIKKITSDELNLISKTIHKQNGDLAPLETYFVTLQDKAHKSLSTHPNATENDFYNIAGVKTIRILSIDGGGVKGIIPSLILKRIEERTERPIAAQFDIMAGTSVGGLLTLALNVPNHQSNLNEGLKNKASDLVDRAKDDAQRIFPRKYFSFGDPILINYITSKLWTLFRQQSAYLEGKRGAYSTQGLEEVCRYYLNDTLLRDAFSKVLIPVTEEKDGVAKLKIFNSGSMMHNEPDLSMQTVALRTSRAPLYFATKEVERKLSGQKNLEVENDASYADGGVVLNNPAWEIYHRIDNPGRKLRFIIVSLGTGQPNLSKEMDAGRKTIETMLQSASTHADSNLKRAFEDKTLGQYTRINFSIDKVALNDSSSRTFDNLETETKKYIKSQKGEEEVEEIVFLLKQERPIASRNQSTSEEWFKE